MPLTARTATALDVDVFVDERGEGHPFLLLHGGGGPTTVSAFADHLARRHQARVFTPTHPGFAGTPRPDALHDIRQLAALYTALLEKLDLRDVTVIGNSIGGWIAAEMALLGSPRISSVALVDAVGVVVPGHPVADFFNLTFPQIAELSYHDPDAFRIDPTALPPQAQAALAANRRTLALYAGEPSMVDPTLLARLTSVALPTLVVWGDSDRIVDPDYGRAYAAAIPGARFELLTDTGHLPQLETPDLLADTLWAFADQHATRKPR